MDQTRITDHLPVVGDGSSFGSGDRFHHEEIQLALRNRGMPLEALRYPITPSGLHYLLVHFDIPDADPTNWQLEVDGLAKQPLRLSLDDILGRDRVTVVTTMECAGNGRALLEPRNISQPWLHEAVSTAEWTGASLSSILDEAGIADDAVEVIFTGRDRGIQGGEIQSYQRSLSIAEVRRPDVIIAYEMNGQPLQPQHGAPLRLVVPGWYGMTSVKWLERITVVAQPFEGFQMVGTYRYSQGSDELGEPVTRMRVRALMIPPGIPDFLTRLRLVEAGVVMLTGRAWSGEGTVARVAVSTDDSATWGEATLEPPISGRAWCGWSYRWYASPGRYTLCVHATDAAGNSQPLDQPWNAHGMGNNMVQRVEVIVE